MGVPAGNLEWRDRVAALAAESDADDRARVAAMTVGERLARGVALSRLAIRVRDAFREQARLRG
jgi:hypothetical protein